MRLFVLHCLTLVERTESIARDRRVVDEHVLTVISATDESVALGIVEPLHGTQRHFLQPPAQHNGRPHVAAHRWFEHLAGERSTTISRKATPLCNCAVMTNHPKGHG